MEKLTRVACHFNNTNLLRLICWIRCIQLIELLVKNVWSKIQYIARNLDHRNVFKVIITFLYRWRLYIGYFSILSISFDFIKNFSFLPFIIVKIISMHFQIFVWTRLLESWNHFLFCWIFLPDDKKARKNYESILRTHK